MGPDTDTVISLCINCTFSRKIREDFYDVAQVQSDERPLSLPGQVDRIALPYKTHEYKTLAKALKKSNTKCTYKRPPTIFSLLINDEKEE